MTTSSSPSPLVIEIAPRPDGPAAAREAVASLSPRLIAELGCDLMLVVSELVTNAVKYGPGESIRLELTVHGPDRVSGQVVDQGPRDGVIATVAVPGSHGGYGLRIVDALAARWGIHEGSSHVWFDLDRRTARAA